MQRLIQLGSSFLQDQQARQPEQWGEGNIHRASIQRCAFSEDGLRSFSGGGCQTGEHLPPHLCFFLSLLSLIIIVFQPSSPPTLFCVLFCPFIKFIAKSPSCIEHLHMSLYICTFIPPCLQFYFYSFIRLSTRDSQS